MLQIEIHSVKSSLNDPNMIFSQERKDKQLERQNISNVNQDHLQVMLFLLLGGLSNSGIRRA